MKKTSFCAVLALAAVSAATVSARTTITVETSGDNNGAVFDVSDDLVLDFTQSTFSISGGAAESKKFNITDQTVIRFSSDASVEDIDAAAAVALRSNPVESSLQFTAAPQQPCVLRVFSLQGSCIRSVDAWQGEDVDVSSLSTGLYILNFNNQSIKFYKK